MKQKRILIVDDCRTTVGLMEKLVRKLEGCEPVSYLDPAKFVDAIDAENFDVAIIDYMMPKVSGIELVHRLQSHHKHKHVPIVMITADRESGLRLEAFEGGVIEFLNKPIEPMEFRARIRNLARLRDAQYRAEDTAGWLSVEVENTTRKIREREEEVVRSVSNLDNMTGETARRLLRVATISKRLAQELGYNEGFCSDIRLATMMQDPRDVAACDANIEKPDQLKKQPHRQAKMRALVGRQTFAHANLPLVQMIEEISRLHHERWDGRGYPHRLKGEEIPISARIVAVADAFDALTSKRMYKEAWSVEKTIGYLKGEGGKRFDPECVSALAHCVLDVTSETYQLFGGLEKLETVAAQQVA